MGDRPLSTRMAKQNYSNERLGKPIQILKDSEDFEIDRVALYEVLCHPDVGDKPISVVSVIGPYRTGKSFLLNYFLLYLDKRGHEANQETSWMLNDDRPLEGFLWGGGSTLITKGIFIWNKPFIIKRESKEIAIFIVDTQGSFDMESHRSTYNTAFMLTMLMSSCTIFNLKDVVGLDDLEHLEFCVAYSKMVNESEGPLCQLQDFWILLRDWQSPCDYEYGVNGGQKYAEDKIFAGPHDNQASRDKLSKVQRGLKESFDNLMCYLMPSPGDKAAIFRGPGDFMGNVTDLLPEFVMHLNEFCHNVLHPSNLSEKKNMTGITLFYSLIEVCNNMKNNPGCLPRMESHFSAEIHARCTEALLKWTGKYRKGVEKKIGSVYQEPEKFKKIIDTQRQKKQVKFFRDLRASKEYEALYEDIFARYIIVINMELEVKNDRLWMVEKGKLAQLSQSVWSEYKKNMEEAITANRSQADLAKITEENHKNFLHKAEKSFNRLLEKMEARENSEVTAAKKLLEDIIDCTHRTIIVNFEFEQEKSLYEERKILLSSEKYKEDNKSESNPVLRDFHARYDKAVEEKTGGKVASERTLEEIKNKFSARAIDVYEDCKREVPGLKPVVSVKQLKAAIDTAERKHKELNKLREIESYIQYFELIKLIFEEIKRDMNKTEEHYIGQPLVDTIEENRRNYKAKCLEFISNNYMESDKDVYIPPLSKLIEELCKIWIKLDGAKKILAEVVLHLLMKDIEIQYLTKMQEEILESHADVEELEMKHSKIVEELLNVPQGRESKIIESTKDSLENALNKHFDGIKEWSSSNKSFFKRVFGGVAGGTALAAGGAGAASFALITSLEVGLVAVGVATAATGVGIAVLAGVAVGGIGYGIYRGTRKSKASDYLGKQSEEVKGRVIGEDEK